MYGVVKVNLQFLWRGNVLDVVFMIYRGSYILDHLI